MNTDMTYKSNVEDEGEKQLAILIHQAGDDARIRRKKMMDEHFKKLADMITEAVSSQKRTLPA